MRQRAAPALAGCLLLALIAAGLGGVPLPSLEKNWSIGIYEGATSLALRPASGVTNPVMSAAQVTDAPAVFVADPFMRRDDTGWSMFFEVFRADSRQGDIGLATSADGLKWTYRQIVLDEPFHLSFPHVFVWNSVYYMIPETREAQEIRLYRAQTFPTSWVLDRTLVKGGAFTDSSIVRHQGRWWLFAESGGNSTLSLFFADTLDGHWTPHPRNPILQNAPDRARPAGRIVLDGERLFRLAQDDAESYGSRVYAFEITELTPTQYAERMALPSPVVDGSGRGWNAGGMHHVDAHQVEAQRWIASVDGFRKKWMFGFRRWPPTQAAE